MLPTPRQSRVLNLLRTRGRLSRSELHEQSGLRPNTIGEIVNQLIEAHLIRETDTQTLGRGRPRVPLEINPDACVVLGLALRQNEAELAALNLRGQPVVNPAKQRAQSSDRVIAAARSLYLASKAPKPLLVGIAVPGLIDTNSHRILISSASTLAQNHTTLDPIYRVLGEIPALLDNDMHALAANWVLTRQANPRDDVLLVHIRDGELGSALLVDGKPNHGCIVGANELGHTRLPIDTELCYCGHRGCLERIASSNFLRSRGMPPTSTLAEAIHDLPKQQHPALTQLIRHLATGLANAVNFIRPNRLVVSGPLLRNSPFTSLLIESIQQLLLPGLADRILIEAWDESPAAHAEAAAFLALAAIYLPNWSSPITTEQQRNESPDERG